MISIYILSFAIQGLTSSASIENSSAKSNYILDSSIKKTGQSDAEIVQFLNEYDASQIDNAFVFINSGTAAGKTFNISAEDNRALFSDLVFFAFNPAANYYTTIKDYKNEDYAFYITYSCEKGSDNLTIFVFDDSTIRYNGQFLTLSKSLDYTVINTLIQSSGNN